MGKSFCLFLVSFLVLFILTKAQDLPPPVRPLPTANGTLVDNFKLALQAIFTLGIRLQTFLHEEGNENIIVSPFSTALIISQLALGAENEFQKVLIDLLSLPNAHLHENTTLDTYAGKNSTEFLPYASIHLQMRSLLTHLRNPLIKKEFILKESSALFYNQQLKLKEQFISRSKHFYETKIVKINFNNPSKAQKIINKWAVDNTNGLIPEILPTPPTRNTAAIFSNAIYFKADWEIPFSDILNRRGSFSVNEDKKVDVTYMIGMLESVLYSESDEYRIVGLPYKNEELGMYIMLPNENSRFKYDLKGFLQHLSSKIVAKVVQKSRRRDVIIKLPKMTIRNSFSILDQLKKYQAYKMAGGGQIKTNASNVVDDLKYKVEAFNNYNISEQDDLFLTNAADKPLRVDNIMQQVFLSVNEKGTEAAAISASTIDYIGGQKNFLVDRPFAFFIRHEATSATLFWGSVSNPAFEKI